MRRTISALAIGGALALLPALPALAHGDHEQGDLAIATGFAVEPAYAGQPNAVELIITHAGNAVVDLQPDDLSVDVTFGDQTTTLSPEAAFEVGEFGTPGTYHAAFIPSQPGKYAFHVTGTIDGEKVDYTMSSGPKTFSEVIDPQEATFPAVDAPTNTDLAARLEQESTHAAAATTAATSAQVAASAAQDAADTARLIAIAAVIVAVIAIGLAVMARRSRGRETT